MSDKDFKKIGELSEVVVRLLVLEFPAGTSVYIGQSNIEHIRASHPYDFSRFYPFISELLASPEFIGINAKDNSIEFIKKFHDLRDSRNFVKLAVRLSNDGFLFARSLYEVLGSTVLNRVKQGTLKRLTS